jgi:hypothetical protein
MMRAIISATVDHLFVQTSVYVAFGALDTGTDAGWIRETFFLSTGAAFRLPCRSWTC